MSTRTYTLKEVVEILSRGESPDERDRLARQLRHWTTLDLLVPEGKKHTGTGISRRYRACEIRKAAVLRELSTYHVPVTVLDLFREPLAECQDTAEWTAAVEGTTHVFLNVAFTEKSVSWQLVQDEPGSHFLVPVEPGQERFVPRSAIVMNLTRIFKGLQL